MNDEEYLEWQKQIKKDRAREKKEQKARKIKYILCEFKFPCPDDRINSRLIIDQGGLIRVQSDRPSRGGWQDEFHIDHYPVIGPSDEIQNLNAIIRVAIENKDRII